MNWRAEQILDRALGVLKAVGGRTPLSALFACVQGTPEAQEQSLTEPLFEGWIRDDARFDLSGSEVTARPEALEDRSRESGEELGSEPAEAELTLDSSIERLDVCNRAKNQLPRNGIRTLRDLLRLSEEETLQLANIGRKTAADILRERRRLATLFGEQGAEPGGLVEHSNSPVDLRAVLDSELVGDPTPIRELMLSFRPENVLRSHGYETVGQLAALSEEALLGFRNLGDSSLREIRRRLISFREHRVAVREGRAPERPEFESADEEWKYAANCLSSRDRRIVEVRFGLFGGERPTLSQVSRKVGVTRERVRQIATNGATLVGRMPLQVAGVLETVLEEQGGIGFIQDLADEVAARIRFDRLDPLGYCELLLSGCPTRFRRVPGTRARGLWTSQGIGEIEVEGLLEVAEELVAGGALLKISELAAVVRRSFFDGREDFPAEALERPLMGLLPHTAETADGRLYDRRWGAEERCAGVLRTVKESLHFSEVARRATELFSDRAVSERRALSCMVDSELFCRVGDGRYSLKELGDEHVGHVRELIVRVLGEADRPLHREEILERVGQISPYQPGTITSGLYCASERIEPLAFSVFALRDAPYEELSPELVSRIRDLLPADGSAVLVKNVLLELSRHHAAGEIKAALARMSGLAVRGCGGSMSVAIPPGGQRDRSTFPDGETSVDGRAAEGAC